MDRVFKALIASVTGDHYKIVTLLVEDYYFEIEEAFSNSYQFKKLHDSPKEKNLSFFIDVKTKYEQKAINKGLCPSYLVYKKV